MKAEEIELENKDSINNNNNNNDENDDIDITNDSIYENENSGFVRDRKSLSNKK